MYKLALASAAALLVLTGCFHKNTTQQPPAANTNLGNEAPSPATKTMTVQLAALNNSGQSGTATLSEVGGTVVVSIAVDNPPQGVSQPAHIHSGSCPTPGGVTYPLSPVVNGVSETSLPVSLDALLAQAPNAINVHKSGAEAGIYVACGDITANQPTGSTESNTNTNENAATKPRTSTFDLTGSNFAFSLKEIRVKKGDTVTINFTNNEGFHDWSLDEFSAKTPQIGAGKTESVTFTASKAGTFEYYCSVGQHRQFGMVGKLIVE